ncbi:MAG: hypothetical protein JJE32_07400 [Deltaproteobacteria bacterium]|nr:hypothetical protein [Deltaproteobacteria bacterium]
MARLTTHRPDDRKSGPKDNPDLLGKVVKGKKGGQLEFLLLGLMSACIGVLFFLIFFRG